MSDSIETAASDAAGDAASSGLRVVARRHRVFGWWSLAVYMGLGLLLEGLHGIKASFYLDPGHTLRREMWTLAHTHGTLLAIVNLAFAASLERLRDRLAGSARSRASHLLTSGSLLMPLGFFLGGAFATEHDPWSGVLLVPLGAVCIIVAALQVAMAHTRAR